jgi:hypothetical protein
MNNPPEGSMRRRTTTCFFRDPKDSVAACRRSGPSSRRTLYRLERGWEGSAPVPAETIVKAHVCCDVDIAASLVARAWFPMLVVALRASLSLILFKSSWRTIRLLTVHRRA